MSDPCMAPSAPRRPGDRPFGSGVAPDDLAWMREPGGRDALRAWLAEERRWYDDATRSLRPLAATLAHEASERVAGGEASSIFRVGAHRYRTRRPAGAEHERLVRVAADGSDEAVLLDLDALRGTSAFARLGDLAPSPDGEWLAYTLDLLGNERYELRLRHLATGREVGDPAANAYYGLAWTADSASILYLTTDGADRPCRLRRHLVGTPFTKDELVLEETDERFHLTVRPSGDGRHLIIRAASRLTAEEWALDLGSATAAVPVTLLGREDGHDDACDLTGPPDGPAILLAVREEADRERLVRMAWAPGIGSTGPMATLLEGEPGDRFLEVLAIGTRAIVRGRRGGMAHLWVVSIDGDEATIPVAPSIPWSEVDLGRGELPDGSVELVEEGRITPPSRSCLDLGSGVRTAIPSIGPVAPDPARYRIETLTATATDGVAIPVSVIRRADVPLDGSAPCLLYGYGAWELVTHPAYDPVLVSILERGVVYAHARVRGGGELGRAWWRGGRMARKSTTFSDFAAAADRLADGLVDGRRIVARGHSAGGLLMGVAWTDRPDRWAGVVAEVPFVDPVTTMSDPGAPLVIVERDEWGDPRRAADLAWMRGWAPYERIPAGPGHPPLLVTTAIEDPRVSPWEPARWVARLRDAGADPRRLLLRADLGPRGHWPPPGRSAGIAYQAEIGAWILDRMGIVRQADARSW